jgi:hypothetical protein
MENIQDFKIREPNGNLKEYEKGDVVRKNGKEYVASKTIRGYSPEHGEKRGWKEINKTRITKFSKSTSEPEMAQEGDHWFNTDSGKLLLSIKLDDGSTQWAEI